MKCENLQFNLPFYAEGVLTDDESRAVDSHLERCPLCRARLTEFQSLQNDLRTLPRVEASADFLNAVRKRVAVELKPEKRQPFLSSGSREWLQFRLMPYTVGTIASLALTLAFLMTLLSTREGAQKGVEAAQIESNRNVVYTASNSNSKIDEIDSFDYSAINLRIADESPSINPTGALLALTKSIVRGKMKDEEVVVVADVFGNGIARIAEVVEAPRDRRSMLDLERALSDDPSYAPFVPAREDNRSNHVRVILKIQRVDVIEKTPRPKNKPRSL